LTELEAAQAKAAFDAYGSDLYNATLVKSWQQRVGAKPDGIPGPETRRLLAEATRPTNGLAHCTVDAGIVEKVLRAIGTPGTRASAHAPRLARAMADYGITTPLRAAHFLAQIAHESANLRYMEEIATGAAYEGRRDLGNTQAGDGRRFKGRGPLQVTGRANYKRLADHLKAKGEPDWDVVSKPELVAGVHAFTAAGEWWQRNQASRVSDEGDTLRAVQKVSRLVNRGNANAPKPANHEAERVALFKLVAKALREAGAWT
jgi:predicted chitinase